MVRSSERVTIKSGVTAMLGLVSTLWALPAGALTQVTVTIGEIEITDGDFDAGRPIFPDLIQYHPIFGDFPGHATVRPPLWNERVRVCEETPRPTHCERFVRSPAWVFSTTVEPAAGSVLFRFVIHDEVNDTSPLPLILSPPDGFVGTHERGLYLVIDPLTQTWIVRGNAGGNNPTVSVGHVPGAGNPNDLNATVRFSVDFSCTPSAEICDGADNDCDGLTDAADPDFSAPLLVCPGDPGVPGCAFTLPRSCVGGVLTGSCPAPDPSETACNFVDDNCNGLVDEGATNIPEICDGFDNDCDGNVDAADGDFVAPTQHCPGVGPDCSNDVPRACVGGVPDTTCPAIDATETACNGVDDDCNGRVDEGYQNQRVSVDLGNGVCSTTTRYCERFDGAQRGVEQDSEPIFGDGGPEVPDGINNDCSDGQIDECEPGQTDWWCHCAGGDVEFVVDRFDDAFTKPDPADPASLVPDADTAASFCLPTSEPATGMCTLRGVFRRAEQLDYLGCRVVAALPAGTLEVMDELRLGAGDLVLRGAGSDPSQESCDATDPVGCVPASTAITTLDPCTEQRTAENCACAVSSPYRLINAISIESPSSRLSDGLPAAPSAALSLSLQLEDLILRGGLGEPDQFATALAANAGGALVLEGGAFAARNIFVRDNRARGLGSGLAIFDSPSAQISDSVVTNNMNNQTGGLLHESLGVVGEVCTYVGASGGFTGFGGGIYMRGIEQALIDRCAIVGNVGPDGAGVAIVNSDFTVRNSTIAGNRAGGAGSGVYFSGGHANLLFNTIVRNYARQGGAFGPCPDVGGAVYGLAQPGKRRPTLVAFGNVIADSFPDLGARSPECVMVPHPTCGEPVLVQAAGFNLLETQGDGCDGLQDAPGNVFGEAGLELAEDQLLPAGNSSAALVYALDTTSSAVAAYPSAPAAPAPSCADATGGVDQRIALRPGNGPCAIGSWESSATFAGFARSGVVSGVFASQAVLVRDRAQVLAPIDADTFSLGFDAVISGDVSAAGDGFLADRAVVLGSATLGGVLGGDREGVTGGLLEGTSVVPQQLLEREGTSSGVGVDVPHDGLSVLAPGSYGHVVVRSRATLELGAAGLYRFASLTFEPDGFLSIAGDFDVALAIDGNLILGDRFDMAVDFQSTLDSRHLFLYSGGAQVEYGHDVVVVGHLEAPNAHVEVRDRALVRGTVAGASVTLGFDTVVGPRAAAEPG